MTAEIRHLRQSERLMRRPGEDLPGYLARYNREVLGRECDGPPAKVMPGLVTEISMGRVVDLGPDREPGEEG